jgi:hypothetical protein
MVSPGMIATALTALAVSAEPFVYTIGMHLGPKPQNELVEQGWTTADEDRLLASVDWARHGYRLFGNLVTDRVVGTGVLRYRSRD